MARLARDELYFTLVRDCARTAATKILIGDARLRLQEMPGSVFDLMILDAYSSDAIPIHLLTREALALYRSKLTPGGVLMFHISNRHLRLDRVIGALVRDAGMASLIQKHSPDSTAPKHVVTSEWVAVAERPADLSALRGSGKWKALPKTNLRPWTDDYSNIIPVLR